MKTTVVYTRVSTDSQDTAAQERDLRHWLADRQAIWFTDSVTGRTMNRPGWAQLCEMRRSREVSEIVVWRLDRLGRTASGLTKLFDELNAEGVNLVSLKDSLDLSTPAGRLMANVLASVAQYETEVRGERVKAGIAAARANGKKWGGRRPGVLYPDKLRAALTLHLEGMSVVGIAGAVGMSRQWVHRMLKKAKIETT